MDYFWHLGTRKRNLVSRGNHLVSRTRSWEEWFTCKSVFVAQASAASFVLTGFQYNFPPNISGKFSFPYLKMPSTEETWELVPNVPFIAPMSLRWYSDDLTLYHGQFRQYSSRPKNQGMTQGNKTSYTTWWLMLILWHMWNIQPGSTRAFGAMETSRYCEGIDCFYISKCPARANFRFRRVIPVLIKYWYKFTENYFWRASFRALRLSCLLSGAFCRGFSHIFAFSVCNGPWIVPFGDAFWQTNILQSRICHRSI